MWSISWMFALESSVIVAGNIITIVIFTTTPRLRRRQYVLMISLAVADLFVGLVSVPMHIAYEEVPHLKMNTTYVLPYLFEDLLFGSASLIFLALLAIERAHATYFPFKHNTLGKVPYIIGITLAWLLAVLSGLSSYLIASDLFFYLIMKFSSILILLMIICGAYVLILVKVRCWGMTSNQEINQENKKLTTTLAIVTIISLATWIPYKITLAYVAVYPRSSASKAYWLARNICKVPHYANSLANFFVYALRMREFRSELMRRFRCSKNRIFPHGGVEMVSKVKPNCDIEQNTKTISS